MHSDHSPPLLLASSASLPEVSISTLPESSTTELTPSPTPAPAPELTCCFTTSLSYSPVAPPPVKSDDPITAPVYTISQEALGHSSFRSAREKADVQTAQKLSCAPSSTTQTKVTGVATIILPPRQTENTSSTASHSPLKYTPVAPTSKVSQLSTSSSPPSSFSCSPSPSVIKTAVSPQVSPSYELSKTLTGESSSASTTCSASHIPEFVHASPGHPLHATNHCISDDLTVCTETFLEVNNNTKIPSIDNNSIILSTTTLGGACNCINDTISTSPISNNAITPLSNSIKPNSINNSNSIYISSDNGRSTAVATTTASNYDNSNNNSSNFETIYTSFSSLNSLEDLSSIQTYDFVRELESSRDVHPSGHYISGNTAASEVFMDTSSHDKNNNNNSSSNSSSDNTSNENRHIFSDDRCVSVFTDLTSSPRKAALFSTDRAIVSFPGESATVLPSFSSTFNDAPSFFHSNKTISHHHDQRYQQQQHRNHHHYHQHLSHNNNSSNVNNSASQLSPNLSSSYTTMRPNLSETSGDMFQLSRSDSGFSINDYVSSTCSSRNSSSSMDFDYEDTGCFIENELSEERRYTCLTSVRSLCHNGQELLPSIVSEDEENLRSLEVFLPDSGAMEDIKSEPLNEYDGFNVGDLMNHLKTSDLESDGYESSSTDNGQPHFTKLEEASSYSLFDKNTIMGGFPQMPVTPNEHTAKLPTGLTFVEPHYPEQASPECDQGFVDSWMFAKENLPDFEKLQHTSPEETEKPASSRRRSVSSPKEKKKAPAARESPALSDKSSSSDRKKPGRKKGQVSNVLHLWEFMRDLLRDPTRRGDIIEWISEKDGVFRVVNSAEVARLWGEKKKNKKEMTYEKMSRSLRYSREEGYFSDLPKDKNYPKKLCFKFGPKSKDWS